MDQGTRYELDNLRQGYREALERIENATDNEERVAAWRSVQTLGWRLHELLSSGNESLSA